MYDVMKKHILTMKAFFAALNRFKKEQGVEYYKAEYYATERMKNILRDNNIDFETLAEVMFKYAKIDKEIYYFFNRILKRILWKEFITNILKDEAYAELLNKHQIKANDVEFEAAYKIYMEALHFIRISRAICGSLIPRNIPYDIVEELAKSEKKLFARCII